LGKRFVMRASGHLFGFRRKHAATAIFVALLSACASKPVSVPVTREVIGRNNHFAIMLAQPGDSYADIALRYLDSESLGWRIAEFNNYKPLERRTPVIIPLADLNTTGVTRAGVQRVPVLCYHRFTSGGKPDKLEVTAAQFEEQMTYLRQNGYSIVSFADFNGFLRGQKQLPRKSVVITIDDGYRTIYSVAWPIIQRFKIPVTAFIYPDFIGSGAALTWSQIRELRVSGLISFQSHSKSHTNMLAPAKGETQAAYSQRVATELEASRSLIGKQLGQQVDVIAYPYGGANPYVVERTRAAGYDTAATVVRGTNPAYASTFLVRRDMIFGTDTLAMFARRLGQPAEKVR
jgi:peptidoglycan/xylan/chitin deacetylase (PgdA/CDA1 family)